MLVIDDGLKITEALSIKYQDFADVFEASFAEAISGIEGAAATGHSNDCSQLSEGANSSVGLHDIRKHIYI
jgi:hypothetical protein